MCWPLSHASLTLEMQLCSSAADVCASPTPAHATNATGLPAVPRSEQFKILLPRLCFSMITLSSVGQAEYDRILSSTGLNMSLNSYVTLQAAVVDKSPRVSFSRSLANIRECYVTFYRDPVWAPTGNPADNNFLNAWIRAFNKECNYCFWGR